MAYLAHGQTLSGQRYLAMEWLEGEDLCQRLARGPLTIRQGLLLLYRVCDALSLAHQRGILHRDLKPSNLFLPAGQLDRVKLLDFGIARRMKASLPLTHSGAVLGTPEYMAPEQACGQRELTPAADVFSLGCILYECLTGKAPFVADHLTAVLVRILFEEPTPLDAMVPGVADSLVQLISSLEAEV